MILIEGDEHRKIIITFKYIVVFPIYDWKEKSEKHRMILRYSPLIGLYSDQLIKTSFLVLSNPLSVVILYK